MNETTRYSNLSSGEPVAYGRPDGVLQYTDLSALLSVLRANIWLIVLVTLLSASAMFVYLQVVPPIYTASAKVMLDTREERATPVEKVVSDLSASDPVIAGEVEMIRSNVLIGEVVDQLGLMEHPKFDPRVPRSEGVFTRAKRMVRGGDPPHVVAARLSEEQLRSWVIGTVRSQLAVERLGVSYAIEISFDSGDPTTTAAVANGVAERYIDSQLDKKLAATMRANAWLSEQLLELSAQVEAADGEVVAFKSGMIDAAGGSEESISQLLVELNKMLVAGSTAHADAKVRLGQVEALQEVGGLAAVADVVTSPLLETLLRHRSDLASDQAQLASTFGRRHPEMVRISAQIANIDRSIEAELTRRVEEMRSDVVVTRNREAALKQQIEEVSERTDKLSKASVRLSQLERASEATRAIYGNFLGRFKETSAQAGFQTPEARIIGVAEIPTVPSSPRKTLFMLMAIVFGMSAAIAWVFICNLVKAPITNSDELRAVSRRPGLAPLPFVRGIGRYRWLRRALAGKGNTNFMEHIRSIRVELFELGQGTPPEVLLVTSSLPGEGKTSVACALVNSLSRSGKSVLLLDADLHHPDVRSVLKLPSGGACLVGYLERREKLMDLPQHSELLNADVIVPRRRADNAGDLLGSKLFEGMMMRMSSRYDVIVVNAPPVLHLSDAIVLAKNADATLYTVRCASTPAKVVRRSIHRLESAAGICVAGVVMTMVRRKDAAARETEMYGYHY
ncbi:GumC family protein [Aliiruegeria lutimaris]|uniref:Capsular exopolysaccharide family n=1 Tax=Aliiruegeria lutimaris TaxID=571298 RepID=A0A1G9P111_9RHOB|nr:polysaccharide biosynthesis tyrosine autokinase [Aliiruegeria lutimaris]SDL92291.1 capsular exopolysaccharide family [Aliiruegeria lutimaris]